MDLSSEAKLVEDLFDNMGEIEKKSFAFESLKQLIFSLNTNTIIDKFRSQVRNKNPQLFLNKETDKILKKTNDQESEFDQKVDEYIMFFFNQNPELLSYALAAQNKHYELAKEYDVDPDEVTFDIFKRYEFESTSPAELTFYENNEIIFNFANTYKDFHSVKLDVERKKEKYFNRNPIAKKYFESLKEKEDESYLAKNTYLSYCLGDEIKKINNYLVKRFLRKYNLNFDLWDENFQTNNSNSEETIPYEESVKEHIILDLNNILYLKNSNMENEKNKIRIEIINQPFYLHEKYYDILSYQLREKYIRTPEMSKEELLETIDYGCELLKEYKFNKNYFLESLETMFCELQTKDEYELITSHYNI